MINSRNTFLTFLFLFCLTVTNGWTQSQPTDIRYGIINLRALRFHPDTTDATDIMQRVFHNIDKSSLSEDEFLKYNLYEKTSIDLVIGKESLNRQLSNYQSKNNLIYKHFIRSFEPWINHARPLEKNPSYLALTTLLFEEHKTISENKQRGSKVSYTNASHKQGLYESIGQQNTSSLMDEVFKDIDLYHEENEIMLLKFKSPLNKNTREIYSYKLIGTKEINGISCFEIAFFCENMNENAFAGYFYISNDGNYSLIETKFTFNNPSNINFLRRVLVTQTYSPNEGQSLPEKKVYSILMGDDVDGSLIAEKTLIYDHSASSAPNIRPIPLTPAQSQIGELIKTASESRSFQNLQNLLPMLLNAHINIGGVDGPVEIGPISQFVSYNSMEGLRLRFGGNTTVKLLDQWLLGGYVAYGLKDKELKYRADLIYSFQPKDKYIWEQPKKLISFTYINDLNIPGQNPLTTDRDNISYSFSHESTNNMSLQKTGLLTFEDEITKDFSFKIGGQVKYDKPMGIVRYMQVQGTDTAHISDISTSELQLSVRFSPGEKFIQNRNERALIQKGDFEVNLNHKIGIKGLLNSEYNYQITEFEAYKKFNLWGNSGTIDMHLSAGKIWNRVPFPLSFIPMGNQTYVFDPIAYNCMSFYEFATDNYVAGNMGFIFNWSPIKLFNPRNKVKTTLGARAIYGPLSDNNNPAIHPELFVFNNGVNPLGNTPYTEVNIGLANILKILRIDYARRLTYLGVNKAPGHKLTKGTLLFSVYFSF